MKGFAPDSRVRAPAHHQLAARLTGPRRYVAYQALETDLSRNAAPSAPLFNSHEADFFSTRIGCQVFQPVYQIDLAALCLERSR